MSNRLIFIGLFIFIALIGFIALTGYQSEREAAILAKIDNLNKRVDWEIESNTKLFSGLLKMSKINNNLLKMCKFKSNEIVFSPSSEGYAYFNTDEGDFLVALEKLTKYVDGYKASFKIGNPSSIRYENAIITLRWGEPKKPSQPYEEWEKTLKRREINVVKSSLSGVWNKVDIVLSPATAKETGFIGLSLKINKAKTFLTTDFRKTA